MTALPPRKISTPSKISKQNVTPLQILLQMGFPKHRAIKALAATGNRSVQLASDWLLTHVGDGTIDEDVPREYILYACPTGPLLQQLHEHWARSKELCGWNGAHNFTPHVTLVSFFKAPDECSLQLSKALKHVMETLGQPSDSFLTLEPYVSPNFMGLFVSEEHAEYLKKIAVQYVKHVSSSIGLTVDTYEQLDALATCFPWCAVPQEPPQSSICLEPHVKSLHITLAYQFPSSVYPTLKTLAENLQPLKRASWELRLYSRDPRLATHQVHKVKHVYTSRESDELELRIGDYIYIEEKALHNSPDGWVQGISWLTGVTGYLPAIYTERTAESDAWTLHRAIPLGLHNSPVYDTKYSSKAVSSTDESLSAQQYCEGAGTTEGEVEGGEGAGGPPSPEALQRAADLGMNEWDLKLTYSNSDVDSVLSKSSVSPNRDEESPDKQDKEKSISSNGIISNGSSKIIGGDHDHQRPSVAEGIPTDLKQEEADTVPQVTRDMLVMRHGERVDFTYGAWAPYCFDEQDNYIRKDMNMPPSLPKRTGGSAAYTADCPLTMVGLLQARLVGEGLRLAGVTLSHVYSSPSYRCVQTAMAMLEGLNSPSPPKIRIEPGLFEWLVWYPAGPPGWMTVAELQQAGFPVDPDYHPFARLGTPPFVPARAEDAECLEDCDQFYERSANLVKHILQTTEDVGGAIMLVGHASTLDTSWRGVAGLGARAGASLSRLMQGVPYCSLACFRGPPWHLAPPPCPPLMNTSNKRFDWKLLKDE